ncbi:MAG: hypothetical protein AAGC95_05205 [Pseudomonadota bacterium]
MRIDINLNFSERCIKAENFDISLDPDIIRIVKLLARRAAEEDFKEAIRNSQN